MNERTQRVSALLHEAGEVHHVVYRITDGADDDWASFYADWLIDHSELPEALGRAPTRRHLVHELVESEQPLPRPRRRHAGRTSTPTGLSAASADSSASEGLFGCVGRR
jgi:hypothetical protein